MEETAATGASFAEIVQRETAFIIAHLVRLLRDLDRAEDIFQETLASALVTWNEQGMPSNPGAWLTTAARNRAIDALRRDKRLRRAHAELGSTQETSVSMPIPEENPDIEDDRLKLIFTCCHPALTVDSQIALTLRLVAGLTTAEIARAFVTTAPIVAQRLVRAKRAIHDAGLRYEIPERDVLDERLTAVLRVIYLVFNEGYVASAGGELSRIDLAEEAVRLARCLVELMPAEPEGRGLFALLLLQSSRTRARTDADGQLVLLENQDRALWDHARIAQARDEIRIARAMARAQGPYILEAEIAACHAEASSFGETDWTRIGSLYEALEKIAYSPIIRLNRAVAIAFSSGPDVGLTLLADLDQELDSYHLLHATRGDFLQRLQRYGDAAAAYARAASLTENERERAFLLARAQRCRTLSQT